MNRRKFGTYNEMKEGIKLTNQANGCDKEAIIHQLVKVQAQVTITPLIKHGKPEIYCVETYFKPLQSCDKCNCNIYNCKCNPCKTRCETGKCEGTFNITQVFCIEIPISFDVDVDVAKGLLCCDSPSLGPCLAPPENQDCKD